MDPGTENFYFNGHGSIYSIGQKPSTAGPINLQNSYISGILGNRYGAYGHRFCHPYRLVFLDACDTAGANYWSHAFGIVDRITYAQAFQKGYAQAFIGWYNEARGPDSDDDWYDVNKTYLVFWSAWMSGWPLEDCYRAASTPDPPAPFDSFCLIFPYGIDWPWYEYAGQKIGLKYNPVRYRARIFGYPGLTRGGFVDGYDNSPYQF
jgi:hypothetical protein